MPLFTIKANDFVPVPPGNYKATFSEIDCEFETSKGKAFRWKFTVQDGERSGDVITSLSDRESPPTPKNRTGKFLAFLAGKTPSDGLSVDPDAFKDELYLVTVGDNGRIEHFVKLSD